MTHAGSGILLDIRVPVDRFSVSLRWETGESSLGIFGPSGAGKTTVLEALAGLRPSARGVIRVHGQTWLDTERGVCLRPERRGVGYVPQDSLLFPHRDVVGNVLAGSRRARQNSFRRLEPHRVLEVLELTELARRPVQSLSGGELRRVALARALCSGPEILLLDEPLSGLDAPLRRRILGYLLRVRREFALPALVVSHDATEIRILSREILLLDQGRVAGRGDPDSLFVERCDPGIAGEEGFENVLRGRVRSIEGSEAMIDLEAGASMMVPAEDLAAGAEVTIGIRSEELILAVRPVGGLSAQNILPARIRELAEPGPGDGPVRVVAELGTSRPAGVVAHVTRRAVRDLGLHPGQPIQLICKARACQILASLPG